MKFVISILLLASLLSISARASPPPGLILDHANDLPMTGAAPIMDATVVIRDGKIAAILARGARHRRGLKRIDGNGNWLVPGLTDAHVRLKSNELVKV